MKVRHIIYLIQGIVLYFAHSAFAADNASTDYLYHGEDEVEVNGTLNFFDDGGPDGFYTRTYQGPVVFRPGHAGKSLRMRFNYFIAGYNDHLLFYNGSVCSSENLLLELYGDKAQYHDLVSTADDGSLTVLFKPGSYGLILEGWDIIVEEFTPDPLEVTGVSVADVSSATVFPGSQDNRLLHITVTVEGEKGEVGLSELTFNTAGSNPSLISNVRVWASGTSDEFAGAALFGETEVRGLDAFTVDGNYSFSQPGEYHFWVTLDIAEGIPAGSQIKGALNSLKFNGEIYSPDTEVVAGFSTRSGMKGDFVVGISEAADYKTFNQAIRALADNGVEGPVRILIENGTYEESVNLLPIAGASEINRVSFESLSGNAADVVVKYGEAKKSLSQGVINFTDGTDFVSIRNLTVTSDVYKCSGLIYLAGACKHITIDGCIIIGHRSASYEERVNLIYATYLEETDKNCNYFTLSNCRLEGGYYGLSATGITNLNYKHMIHDVCVEGNTFVNQTSKALQVMGVDGGLKVGGNMFVNDGSVMAPTYHTIDMYRCTGEVIVSDNMVNLTAGVMAGQSEPSTADAIYIRDITTTRPSVKYIYNNDIRLNGADGSANGLYGIYVNDNDPSQQSLNISYNTIVVTGSASVYSSPVLFASEVGNSTLQANLLQNLAEGTVFRLLDVQLPSELKISGNAFFTESAVWAMLPDAKTSVEEMSNGFGQTVGIAEKADFLADDMHELKSPGSLMSAPLISYVNCDILGNPRHGSTPTIGAYEFRNQDGAPVWNEGYPRVAEVQTNSARIWLSADKASRAWCVIAASDAGVPDDSSFETTDAISLHTDMPEAVSFDGLTEDTEYAVWIRLQSFAGVDAAQTVSVNFRTSSPEPVYTLPVAKILTGIYGPGYQGDELTLEASVSGGMEPLKYEWSDASGNLLGEGLSVSVNLVHSQTYRFKVTDNRGKESVAELNVEVIGDHYVATFDDLYLDPESHWTGSLDNRPFFSGSYAFDNYNGTDSGYSYWGNFTYSNCTSTAYNSMSDQYNSAVGAGVDNTPNYGVAYINSYTGATYLTVTHDADGDTIPGIWLTNSAWVMDAIRNGDGLSSDPDGFKKGDFYKVRITGLYNSHVVDSVVYYLADFRPDLPSDRYALDTWQWVDLSQLGRVNKLWFRVESTKSNLAGMTTPAYFCLDNVGDGCPWRQVPEQVFIKEEGIPLKRLDLEELCGMDSSLASVVYKLSGCDGLAMLDPDTDGSVILTEPDEAGTSRKFDIYAQATQQGRSLYLQIPVRIDFGTGIGVITDGQMRLSVSPDATSISVEAELEGYSVELYDMTGHVLMMRNGLTGNCNLRLPVALESPCLVRVLHPSGTLTRKLMPVSRS